jgi:hypothetical protein
LTPRRLDVRETFQIGPLVTCRAHFMPRTNPREVSVLRQRVAAFADALIPGGHGLPSASGAKVHAKWIDRSLAVRADPAEMVLAVIAGDGDPRVELERLREQAPETFGDLTLVVSAPSS